MRLNSLRVKITFLRIDNYADDLVDIHPHIMYQKQRRQANFLWNRCYICPHVHSIIFAHFIFGKEFLLFHGPYSWINDIVLSIQKSFPNLR